MHLYRNARPCSGEGGRLAIRKRQFDVGTNFCLGFVATPLSTQLPSSKLPKLFVLFLFLLFFCVLFCLFRYSSFSVFLARSLFFSGLRACAPPPHSLRSVVHGRITCISTFTSVLELTTERARISKTRSWHGHRLSWMAYVY